MSYLEIASQLFITLFSLSGVGLSMSHSPLARRWSPVLGLLSQPFWLYTTWHGHQWGIFTVSFVYGGIYAWGFWNHWLRRKAPAGPTMSRREMNRVLRMQGRHRHA